MRNLIVFVVFFVFASLVPIAVCSSDVIPSKYKKYALDRIDESGFSNAVKYEPIVDKYAIQYNIPNWVLLGILYNESNMTLRIVGDHGVGMGMGQVRCSMTSTDRRGRKVFSWFSYLKSRRIPMQVCAELFMDADVSIRSTAAIIAYQRAQVLASYEREGKDFRPHEIWPDTIRAYNLGNSWKTSKKMGYYHRVRAFGHILENRLNQKVCI